jgi:serine/threonine protein kinase
VPDNLDTLPFKIGDILTNYTGVEVEVYARASGGFGCVAFGPDRLSRGRWRALKTIRPEVLQRGEHIREMFIREGLTWMGVWPHVNIVTAQFVTQINGLPFLVLDYADQGSLRRHLRPNLSIERAFIWAQHIAAGMAHLHKPAPDLLRPDPIIHRDLKPDNILLRDLGDSIPSAQITDFGLAKTQAAVAQAEAMVEGDEELEEGTALDNTRSQRYRTERGSALGTPAYMAPEQWADAASAGPAADVYAFGLILGELLTGQHPILPLNERHTKEEWLVAHLSGQHRPLPTVFPIPLHNLYAAMLARRPEQRPTMAAIFTQLQATARQLQLPIYEVPDFVLPTTENQRIFWMGWSDAYDTFGLYPEALVRSDKAYALAPQHPNVLSGRADILAHLGRSEEALAMYSASLAVRPLDDHLGRKIVLHQQAVLLRRVDRFSEAEATYAAALREMPEDASSWFDRAINAIYWGRQELRNGNASEARRLSQLGLTYLQQSQTLGYYNPQMADVKRLLQQVAELE